MFKLDNLMFYIYVDCIIVIIYSTNMWSVFWFSPTIICFLESKRKNCKDIGNF